MTTLPTPICLDQVANQIERLLLCYEELRRTNTLLQSQLQDITHERDLMKSRLNAVRARLDALLERLPEAAGTLSASTGDTDTTTLPADTSATDTGNAEADAATETETETDTIAAPTPAAAPAPTADASPSNTTLRQSIAHAWSKGAYSYAAPSSKQEQP